MGRLYFQSDQAENCCSCSCSCGIGPCPKQPTRNLFIFATASAEQENNAHLKPECRPKTRQRSQHKLTHAVRRCPAAFSPLAEWARIETSWDPMESSSGRTLLHWRPVVTRQPSKTLPFVHAFHAEVPIENGRDQLLNLDDNGFCLRRHAGFSDRGICLQQMQEGPEKGNFLDLSCVGSLAGLAALDTHMLMALCCVGSYRGLVQSLGS